MTPPRPVSLDPDLCRTRQQRLASMLQRDGIDRAILLRPEHVQYLTGFRPPRLLSAAVTLDVGGKCLLVTPQQLPEDTAVDEAVSFDAKWHSTMRQDQHLAVAETLRSALAGRSVGKRIGVEFSAYGARIAQALFDVELSNVIDLDPSLWALRRRKDADELALLRRAIACTEAMYARARELIEPGITELEVFNQLHAAAVEVAGEPLSDLGNDFQANSRGGAARPRAAQAGELFILDLGPAYRGYYADNCRTLTVQGPASDEQQVAWEAIGAVLEMVEQNVRPGVRCRDVFDRAQQMLDAHEPGSFNHHLGHGIGLFPHEGPHLNPNWDDKFDEGDVFTAEPGLYRPALKAGIRLEQDYLVTATGVERLTRFPLEL